MWWCSVAKVTLKSLKICKQCDASKITGMPMTKTTGLVNKKPVAGFVCTGCIGKMVCGWKEMSKV